ncbi:MAG: hypothetical protein N2Z63_03305 [Thiobacillaceae bacterium]|nr:hypothetical protein [Thiobacillaceae bacterium]
MNPAQDKALARLLTTLEVVHRAAVQLAYSWRRMVAEPIDRVWVEALQQRPELAERVEAFASRYGRMQDTLSEKLLPRWLSALAERPASLIENLNRAERLGVLASVEHWLEARKLRNRLVHEYLTDAAAFAADLRLALEYTGMLLATYNRLRADVADRLGCDPARLPPAIELPAGDIHSTDR